MRRRGTKNMDGLDKKKSFRIFRREKEEVEKWIVSALVKRNVW